MNRQLPGRVVLSGREAGVRPQVLINGMVNRPVDLTAYGDMMVQVMNAVDENWSMAQRAELVMYFLRSFELKDEEDTAFDQRIMLEAVNFGALMYLEAWRMMLPGWVPLKQYHFERWLGWDLVLVRQ